MTPLSPTGAAASAAPGDTSAAAPDATLNDAFAQGVVRFMGIMLQGAQSDVQDACNDKVSTPDAPS